MCNASVALLCFFEKVVRRLNEGVEGRGVKLRDGSERGWESKQLLHVDDTVLLVKSRKKLQLDSKECGIG